ncbi:MAG: DsbA family protein [Longimicrobiales bacterium]
MGAWVAVVAIAACGPSEGTPAGDGGSVGSQGSQSVPADMLAEGGTQRVLPAADFPLEELGFDMGEAAAPVKIVEFSDFGCGYCRKFHGETFPTLLDTWVKDGVVQWKYVTYVSGQFPNGLQAAFAAECSGEQGHFDEMSERLYSSQQDWKGIRDPYPIFEEYGKDIGLDMETYTSCIAEERPKARIRSGILAGARLGVRGTPSFLVDGYPLVGAQPLNVWNDILSSRVAELER